MAKQAETEPRPKKAQAQKLEIKPPHKPKAKPPQKPKR